MHCSCWLNKVPEGYLNYRRPCGANKLCMALFLDGHNLRAHKVKQVQTSTTPQLDSLTRASRSSCMILLLLATILHYHIVLLAAYTSIYRIGHTNVKIIIFSQVTVWALCCFCFICDHFTPTPIVPMVYHRYHVEKPRFIDTAVSKP